MRYRVLWIDDEWETQSDFIGFAEHHDIDVEPFLTVEEGLKALESDLTAFHAVILDAKVINRKGDRTAKLDGLQVARDRMIELNNQVYLPFFVFTGQPDYVKSEMFRSMVQEYYIKGDESDKLINDIKSKVDKKAEYIIERDFPDVFAACVTEYLGTDNRLRLVNLIKFLQSTQAFDEDMFNPIRKVLEACLYTLNRYGLLHDKCIHNGSINLAWSSRFICGLEVELPDGLKISTTRQFPNVICCWVYQLKNLASSGSHHEDEGRESNKTKIKELQGYFRNPYIIKSLIYQLLDVVVFCKHLVDRHPDKETNVQDWIESFDEGRGVLHTGQIQQDENGNYYCGKYAVSQIAVRKYRCNVGDTIMVIIDDTNTNDRTKHLYPRFAVRISKL